ncbi:MAG: hypothetical protein BMS9Abin26_1589 [Gammaproteobacteria bacterium]|nr:MAG: hypothetical protein BMS9Abin26_1589 [Gammaproteobacteria bacterium]
MTIKESEALAIAKQFVMDEYQESKLSINYEEYMISLETDGYGHTVLGLNESYWSVTFMLKSTEQDQILFDPDYIIVLVGAQSGEPNWFPVM